MKDITVLCEHKLDDINTSEGKNQILSASMVFDLLQCNLQSSVILRLLEQDIDKRTSCKGLVLENLLSS